MALQKGHVHSCEIELFYFTKITIKIMIRKTCNIECVISEFNNKWHVAKIDGEKNEISDKKKMGVNSEEIATREETTVFIFTSQKHCLSFISDTSSFE